MWVAVSYSTMAKKKEFSREENSFKISLRTLPTEIMKAALSKYDRHACLQLQRCRERTDWLLEAHICIGLQDYLNWMEQGGVHLNLIKHITDIIFNSSIQGHFACGHRMTVNIF